MLSGRWGMSRYLVGYDLEGNRFYEYPGHAAVAGRTRRVVKYRRRLVHPEYVDEQRNLPVQWQAWLSRLREAPPTPEELQTERLRLKQLVDNIAQIEERERGASLLSSPSSSSTPLKTGEIPVIDAAPDVCPPSTLATRPSMGSDTLSREDQELLRKREVMSQSPLSAYRPVEAGDVKTPIGRQPNPASTLPTADAQSEPTREQSPFPSRTPGADEPVGWQPSAAPRRRGGAAK
ncbi:hypothetical protein DACRYDRAFT_107342 [Dacryopinax primogenitus]|uniref:NADH dehydrogenase [ubiquinone] 1 alpha subcomplex subunit n=1 Tax=Dacryopinax primogenitus (strain DJM 731) TaxID=1858805 RepID=M5G106_DACPD|nr:uncharacterized protein DACRYDRAFT_107342 [Dacryopinax primogenitus]EJU02424.1 hypothetical protein DACRYDRAFT_107342 [Dacryopinax primogenitus]